MEVVVVVVVVVVRWEVGDKDDDDDDDDGEAMGVGQKDETRTNAAPPTNKPNRKKKGERKWLAGETRQSLESMDIQTDASVVTK